MQFYFLGLSCFFLLSVSIPFGFWFFGPTAGDGPINGWILILVASRRKSAKLLFMLDAYSLQEFFLFMHLSKWDISLLSRIGWIKSVRQLWIKQSRDSSRRGSAKSHKNLTCNSILQVCFAHSRILSSCFSLGQSTRKRFISCQQWRVPHLKNSTWSRCSAFTLLTISEVIWFSDSGFPYSFRKGAGSRKWKIFNFCNKKASELNSRRPLRRLNGGRTDSWLKSPLFFCWS